MILTSWISTAAGRGFQPCTKPCIQALALGVTLLAFGACGESPPPKPAEPVVVKPKGDPKKLFAEAVTALKSMSKAKKYQLGELKRAFRKVLELDPSHAEANYNLGLIYETEGQFKAAVDAYQAAWDKRDGFHAAGENLAALARHLGENSRAEAIYTRIASDDQKNVGARLALAKIHVNAKRYSHSIKRCREVLQQDPVNMGAFQTLATAYLEMGNLPMAKLVAARGLKADPKDAALHTVFARIHLKEKDLPAAAAELKKAVASNPENLEARRELAELALRYFDFGNAEANFRVLATKLPKDKGAWIGLAMALKGLQRTDESEEIYKKLIKEDSEDIKAIYNLAMLYKNQFSDYDQALVYLKKFADLAGPVGDDAKLARNLTAEVQKRIAELKEAERMQKEAERMMKEAEEQMRKAEEEATKAAAEAEKKAAAEAAGADGAAQPAVEGEKKGEDKKKPKDSDGKSGKEPKQGASDPGAPKG